MTTLRSRILLGALLWTAGLIAFTHVIGIAIVVRYPSVMRLLHGGLMLAVALLLLAAGLAQVRRGMSPLGPLRTRLAAVRAGEKQRVEGDYPAEVQAVVSDLNALLDDRERSVTRALAAAGDLAHGLKTPLAVLSQEAERAAAAGHGELAATIREQVDRMRGQLDYQLAHARAAASGAAPGARCPVADSVEGLSRTLLRLHAERRLRLELRIPPEHVVRSRREDLDEMLGNLLDNAFKWARSRIWVETAADGADIVVTVDDDGPGLDPSLRDAVLRRGVRADQAAPGSGIGLAIVRDLAELHGGQVSLGTSSEGGVRARLRLPAA